MKNFMMIILLMALVGCTGNFQLRNGDLLFQSNEEGGLSSAIDEATGREKEISFSHVGMISIEANGIYVLEAEPERGVHLTPLQNFLDSSAHDEKGRPLVVVERFVDGMLAQRAVEKGKQYIGQPYDFSYLPDNDSMYCSELVYESFLDEGGRHLLRSKPMTFKNADGLTPEYWLDLFSRQHMEVPEGVEGTNPNDMLHDPALVEVFRYY